MKAISIAKHTPLTAAWYFSGTFFRKSRKHTVSITRKKTRPPSKAGIGSRFITARFTASSAAKKKICRQASPAVSASEPTWVMVETMPTGPLISSMDAPPVRISFRLRRTCCTKSRPVYQVYFSLFKKVASSP